MESGRFEAEALEYTQSVLNRIQAGPGSPPGARGAALEIREGSRGFV